jgi:MutS domain V
VRPPRPLRLRIQQFLERLELLAPPFRDWTFSQPTVEAYFRARLRDDADGTRQHALDDQTWRDLGGPALWQTFSEPMSLFGKQWLFDRLRRCPAPDAREHTSARLRAMLDAGFTRDVQFDEAIAALRDADTSIVDWLATTNAADNVTADGNGTHNVIATAPTSTLASPIASLTWRPLNVLLPLMMLCFVALTWYSPLAIVGALFALAGILAVQSRYAGVLHIWERECATLRTLLSGYLAMAYRPAVNIDRRHVDTAKRLLRAVHRNVMLPGVKEYADWFLLGNVRHYERGTRLLRRERDALWAIFDITTELEACVHLASHFAERQRNGATLCFAAWNAAPAFSLIDATHPLVDQAMPLTLTRTPRDRGWLLSGANGVGKSTLLRTVGLNLVLGRALGVCFAREATVSTAPIYASLNNEDNIHTGESLYMAELRRARELLAAAQQYKTDRHIIVLIDEIFRGTNHDEAVAVAAAFLERLASRALVLASTHHHALAGLLVNTLDAVHLARADSQTNGSLALREGAAAWTNGVEMLRQTGFDTALHARAAVLLVQLQTPSRSNAFNPPPVSA